MAQAQRADEGEGQQQHSGRRPEYTAKVGPVEIAVWKNTGKNGEFYTASAPTIRRPGRTKSHTPSKTGTIATARKPSMSGRYLIPVAATLSAIARARLVHDVGKAFRIGERIDTTLRTIDPDSSLRSPTPAH